MWYIKNMKTAIKVVGVIVTLFVLTVVVVYGYLWLKVIFTYQCRVYDGSGFTQEQHQICNDYNTGGLTRVLTN